MSAELVPVASTELGGSSNAKPATPWDAKQTTPPSQNPAAVYIASLSTDASRRTAMVSLRRVVRILGLGRRYPVDQVEWHGLNYEKVAGIHAALLRAGHSASTVNVTLAVLRGVARAAYNLHQMSADTYTRIRQVKSVRGERVPAGRSLAHRELAALMRVCAEDTTPAGARDAAILACMYVGGLRRSEVPGLDLEDYDATTGALLVHGKGNKDRVVYIVNGAGNAMQAWLAVRGMQDGPLFLPINKGGKVEWRIIPDPDHPGKTKIRRMSDQAIYAMLKKRAEQAGIASFSPHDLRRTFVGDLLDAGADISTVQKLAGHASVTTTQRYDRRPEEAKRKAAGLLKVPFPIAQ